MEKLNERKQTQRQQSLCASGNTPNKNNKKANMEQLYTRILSLIIYVLFFLVTKKIQTQQALIQKI